MSEWTTNDLTRQARQHLDALSAAGVQFVPRVAPPNRDPVVATSASLFDEPPPPVPEPEDRRQELALVAEEASNCIRCPDLQLRKQAVFGTGPIDPDLCFIGEAPGRDEDNQGVPFVGAAGQLLDRIIAACGMKREEVYICNIIKCRPPQNRTPKPEECSNCRTYLERQLALVRPKHICCLGNVPAQNLLATKTGITKLRGRFHDFGGIPVLCTFHPAYLLRNPDAKKDVWEDMKLLLAKMGRPVPKGKGQA